MKRFIMLFVALCIVAFSTQAIAQQYSCAASSANLYTVAAKSGLSLRATPSLISEKILAVPHGRTISVCTDDVSGNEVIDGIQGQWVRAFYANQTGYMFDGFLKKQKDISVIHADNWYSDESPEGEYWGLYPTMEQGTGTLMGLDQAFRAVPCNFIQDTIQMREGDEYVSTVLASDKTPLFLFSGIKTDKGALISGKAFENKFLFPGESVYMTTDKATYYIYAKGNALLSKDPNADSPFSMIRNYELRVKRIMGGSVKDEAVYKMDIPSWYGDGFGGGVHLQWVGDLDGDGELDLLLSKTSEDNCWEVIFMMSSKAEAGQFFRQVSSYTECGGC